MSECGQYRTTEGNMLNVGVQSTWEKLDESTEEHPCAFCRQVGEETPAEYRTIEPINRWGRTTFDGFYYVYICAGCYNLVSGGETMNNVELVDSILFRPCSNNGTKRASGYVIPFGEWEGSKEQSSRPIAFVGRVHGGRGGVFKGREYRQAGGYIYKHFVDVKPAQAGTIHRVVTLIDDEPTELEEE